MSRAAACLLVFAAGCGHTLPATLRTGADTLGPAWETRSVAGARVTLHHRDGGAISASIACDAEDEDAPLGVLLGHVLLELDNHVERERQTLVVDGRAALRATIDARLDGVPVALSLVVLKKDGCLVDAQLAAAPGLLDARTADFARFVAGIKVTRRVR